MAASSSSPTLVARIRGAFYGLAICDALGGPCEFKARGTFPLITTLLPNDNFALPAGCFTDDTSQALCLAYSLLANEGKHNTLDQVKRYLRWRHEGYCSSVGYCFDIGNATREILTQWEKALAGQADVVSADSSALRNVVDETAARIQLEFSRERYCGNGSLMRVLPAALIGKSIEEAADLARESSKTTHPHPRCVDACEVYSRLVFLALQGYSKEDLAGETLNLFHGASDQSTSTEADSGGEAWQRDSVLKERFLPYCRYSLSSPSPLVDVWKSKHVDAIKSTGYVVDSLEASLWAFFTTASFSEGAIKVVNLGDDADTVGAIYGGLAGAYYGFDSIPLEWRSGMMKEGLTMVEEVVGIILEFRGLG